MKIDFNPKRNFGLDILRTVAILFVLNVHSAYFFIAYPVLTRTLLALNLDGVTLFFVLSGFLIGSILIDILETNRATFKVLLHFWVRRWFRTLPNYLLILVILTLLGYYFKTIPDPGKVTGYYFFLANFKSAMPDFLFPEAWSLSVEEWFYL